MSIEELMKKHESLLERCFDFSPPEGWHALVDKLLSDISDLGDGALVVQVKEKFGGLRCYADNQTSAVGKLIDAAERESYNICQDCGTKNGVKLRSEGWCRSLCDGCQEKYDKK